MFCKNCGKEIDDRAMVCPNCGFGTDIISTMVNKNAEKEKRANPCAIVGFILSLVALLFTFLNIVVYWIAFAAGFVLSIIGCVKAKKLNSGKGLSVAGIVFCCLSVLLWVLIVCVFAVAIGGLLF